MTLIRTTHRYGFRSGEWAELLTTAPDPEGRDCYVVRFPDDATDFWVADDPDGHYEFKDRPLQDDAASAAGRQDPEG